MLDGRSCVVPRLFSSSCQAENDWSYMKYLLDLDIKNGKRPMEIGAAEDEPQPRKCTKIFDSCHIVETVQISFQQQSCEAKDSVVPQMDEEIIKPLSICQEVEEEAGAWTNQVLAEQEKQIDGDSMELGDHQSDKQQQVQHGDSSDSGVEPSDEQNLQHAENLLSSSGLQSDEQQQHHAGDSSDSGSLLPRMNRDSSIACLSRCSSIDSSIDTGFLLIGTSPLLSFYYIFLSKVGDDGEEIQILLKIS
ncbi:putative F-box/kelch-repeat protein [Sesbania bispinosa]|nr:putative F-box/kelch-repeat protein [Sesbania bispinosa]